VRERIPFLAKKRLVVSLVKPLTGFSMLMDTFGVTHGGEFPSLVRLRASYSQ
jgi:hypothetical protein